MADHENPVEIQEREEAPAPYVSSDEVKAACLGTVVTLFPDICPEYLDGLATQYGFVSDIIIQSILDQQDDGAPYPRQNLRKRKRSRSDGGNGDESQRVRELKASFEKRDYRYSVVLNTKYQDMAYKLLSQEFTRVPIPYMKKVLKGNGGVIFTTHVQLDEAVRTWNEANTSWRPKKTPGKPVDMFSRENMANLPMDKFDKAELAAIEEFKAAREIADAKDATLDAERAEEANLELAKANGDMTECGCCFDEFPVNRMIHCNGEAMHSFCRGCMKQQAETVIGYSKYELTCMSMEGCSAGFSAEQRFLFLDKQLQTALDRIEAEAVLREAGIENLASCPFCPYAAEYPPVEVNKEFRCVNPSCEKVSCRLCSRESHIPKTCAEAALDEGHSARRQIEEAMSEALIRKCNKCQNPFVKMDGCNKISCTRCRTIQCYVCRQTVTDYSHFNDTARGGKQGQCPLFEATEERHQKEVHQAEEIATKKVAEENPDVDLEIFKIRVSERVKKDEVRRIESDPRFQRAAAVPVVPAHIPRRAMQAERQQQRLREQLQQLQAIEAQFQPFDPAAQAGPFAPIGLNEQLGRLEAHNNARLAPGQPAQPNHNYIYGAMPQFGAAQPAASINPSLLVASPHDNFHHPHPPYQCLPVRNQAGGNGYLANQHPLDPANLLFPFGGDLVGIPQAGFGYAIHPEQAAMPGAFPYEDQMMFPPLHEPRMTFRDRMLAQGAIPPAAAGAPEARS